MRSVGIRLALHCSLLVLFFFIGCVSSSSSSSGSSKDNDIAMDSVGATSDSVGTLDVQAGPDSNANIAGRADITLEVNGMQREAIVYVPELAAGASEAPVVLMLHGTSGDGEKFFNISGWVQKADEVGLIAVFPTALVHCLHKDEDGDGAFEKRQVTTKWADGKLGDPESLPLCTAAELGELGTKQREAADHPLADDLAFFDALLTRLEADYSIDRKRIYVSGFSNGAGMSSRLIAERSTRFAAGAASAGTLNIPQKPVERPFTFVVGLGAADTGDEPPMVIAEDMLTTYPQVKTAIIGPWQSVLGLEDPPTYTEAKLDGKKVAHFKWEKSANNTEHKLILAMFEGLDHQYPNGKNHPASMPDLLWKVFEKEVLP